MTTGTGSGSPITYTSYATLAQYKQYAEITSTDASDDAALGYILVGASSLIDNLTMRHFTAVTATKYFAPPVDDTLFLNDDLLTITSITNGDGDVLTTGEYFTLPVNDAPIYAIKLRSSSGLSWQSDTAGDDEKAIAIAGTWAYSATPPDDIVLACLIITKAEASKRSGQGIEGIARVTSAGVVIEPNGIPKTAMAIIEKYKRAVLWP